MQERIHYTQCPVCGSPELHDVFPAKDYTVSHEQFLIIECKHCSLRFTQDIPIAADIAPYYKAESYISHTNTSKGVINRLYQWVRTRTMVKKRKLIVRATGLAKGTLLDIGSGTGSFVNEMHQNGWHVTGLEPDGEARALAKDVFQVQLQDMNGFYALPAGSADAITLWHVMEHVHELQAYVMQLKQVLKENGRLFIAVPNYTSLDAAVYGGYWAAYDVPRHLYHFSPKSIEILMQKNGLTVESYKPMWYDSFYISLLSSKYKNGKSNFIAACWNGLRSNFKALGNVKRCSSITYVVKKAPASPQASSFPK